MTWRRLPPVYSPIALPALWRAASVAAGVAPDARRHLEERLGKEFGATDVLLTDSGTAALALAIRAAVGPQGVVAVPAYACIDVIAAAAGADAKVVLYDVDPGTLSPDLDSIRKALADGAGALMVAPLYGYPQAMTAIQGVAAEHGVPLIEDAAQSAGARMGGTRIGAFGHLTVLSFGRGKGTTGGSGGALLMRDHPALTRSRVQVDGPSPRGFRDILTLAATWLLARPSVYALPSSLPMLRLGEMVYHPPRQPRPISRAAASLAAAALDLDARELALRRSNAERLRDAAEAGARFTPVQPVPGGSAGYLRFAVLDSRPSGGNGSLGVMRGYPIMLAEHVATRAILARAPDPHPGAAMLRDRLLTLPVHSRMSVHDRERLVHWLQDEGRRA